MLTVSGTCAPCTTTASSSMPTSQSTTCCKFNLTCSVFLYSFLITHSNSTIPHPLISPRSLPLRLYKGVLYFIDVSQSVEHDHPNSLEFLRMDCQNVNGITTQKPRRLTFHPLTHFYSTSHFYSTPHFYSTIHFCRLFCATVSAHNECASVVHVYH